MILRRCRIERDALGEVAIPQEAYYGIGTVRSKEAFQITKHGLSRQMIKSLALCKKIIAKTNCDMGLLEGKKAEAICLSADEILNGRLHGQFITDVLQDGYGYGMDMNAAEVICNSTQVSVSFNTYHSQMNSQRGLPRSQVNLLDVGNTASSPGLRDSV